ncbi:MAG: sulfatase-like hydrolase/transferase [Verrucomicrobia bacterium]|nr:sulfatase-like hydrolase/transferase [Verrucomicrobiota bacterium]
MKAKFLRYPFFAYLLRAVLIGLTTGTFLSAQTSKPPAVSLSKPNVVVIFADDLGYGDTGCYGATKLKTPNIDRLAREGRRFTDAHSASAVCTPSRYCLITGEYAFRGNHWSPVFLKVGLIIDPEQLTVADVMKNAGYATACIGKWHLGFGEETPNWNGDLKPGPLELGFDYYFGVPVVNSHPPFVYVENHRVVGLVPDDPFVYGETAKTQVFPEKRRIDEIGGADAAHALYKDRMVGTRLTEKSVEWIKANKDQPFFLYLATTNIHHPFTPAPRFQGTSECGRYGDFVHELDWIVGEVMDTLEEEGLADNTLVIFTSDNGGMFNVGGQDAWKDGHRLNLDLLGFKFGAWEGGHRVPFIARWPGKIPEGSVSDQLISNVDLLATMAALVDQPLKDQDGPDSFNILPALTGSPKHPIRDHLVLSAFKQANLTIRKGKWVYINAQGSGGFSGKLETDFERGGPGAHLLTLQVNSDIENGKFKKDAPPAQLYDLEADRSQTKNLYNEYPEIVKEMRELLEECKNAERTAPNRI